MDTIEMGKNGCLRLIKRLTPDLITIYPIDDDQVTFGADPSCHIRLYYDDIDPLHCRIFFHERKGFIEVRGSTGLVVDGCHVYPRSSSPSGNTQGFTTIPLPNNTELAIHQKRFVFTYPPKGERDTLAMQNATATPKRNLRLSMIRSAEVFTPKPHPNPLVNLKILKSPVKGRRSVSPVKPSGTTSIDKGEDIILVKSDSPYVTEDEADLVVLDDIPQPNLQPIQAMPVRPARRQSLLRSVVLRNAHKLAMELEDEDEANAVQEYFDSTANEQCDADMQDELEEELDNMLLDQERDTQTEEVMQSDADKRSALGKALRKSLEVVGFVWPFRAGSVQPQDGNAEEEQDITEVSAGSEDDEGPSEQDDDVDVASDSAFPPSSGTQGPTRETARAPPLGEFMTPQRVPLRAESTIRYSLGGNDGPQRINIANKWRVKDISEDAVHEPQKKSADAAGPSTPKPAKPKASEDEKRVIKERRRSAWKEPDMFFGGHAPGLGGVTERRISNIFAPPEDTGSTETADTNVLLARMKETVTDLKRNRIPLSEEEGGDDAGSQGFGARRMSMAERLSLSPTKRKMEWGKAVDHATIRESDDEEGDIDDDDMVAKAPAMSSHDTQGETTSLSVAFAEAFGDATVAATPTLNGGDSFVSGDITGTPKKGTAASNMLTTPPKKSKGGSSRSKKPPKAAQSGAVSEQLERPPATQGGSDKLVHVVVELATTPKKGGSNRSKSSRGAQRVSPEPAAALVAGPARAETMFNLPEKDTTGTEDTVPRRTTKGKAKALPHDVGSSTTAEHEELGEATTKPTRSRTRKRTAETDSSNPTELQDPGEALASSSAVKRSRKQQSKTAVTEITRGRSRMTVADAGNLDSTEQQGSAKEVTAPAKKSTKGRSRTTTAESDNLGAAEAENHGETVTSAVPPVRKSTKGRTRIVAETVDTTKHEESEDATALTKKPAKGRTRITAEPDANEEAAGIAANPVQKATRGRSRTATNESQEGERGSSKTSTRSSRKRAATSEADKPEVTKEVAGVTARETLAGEEQDQKVVVQGSKTRNQTRKGGKVKGDVDIELPTRSRTRTRTGSTRNS